MTSPITANAAVAASGAVNQPTVSQSPAVAVASAPEAKKTEIDKRSRKAEGTLKNSGKDLDRVGYTKEMRINAARPPEKVANENESEEKEQQKGHLDEVA